MTDAEGTTTLTHRQRQSGGLTLNRLNILGTHVHDVSRAEASFCMKAWLGATQSGLRHVVTVNPEFIMAARRDPQFRQVLREAELATVDGVGIVLAARLSGIRIRERVTGVDLTESLAHMSDPAPKIFLLGGPPGIAERAAATMQLRNPDVQIAGFWSGGPGVDQAESIFDRIGSSEATVLLVAFGAPSQDLWIHRNRQQLADCGIVVAIGVGGTFDYLAGSVQRAPRTVRRVGLEWLYRLVRQPWRWRRQLALPHFSALVVFHRIFREGITLDLDHVDFEH